MGGGGVGVDEEVGDDKLFVLGEVCRREDKEGDVSEALGVIVDGLMGEWGHGLESSGPVALADETKERGM